MPPTRARALRGRADPVHLLRLVGYSLAFFYAMSAEDGASAFAVSGAVAALSIAAQVMARRQFFSLVIAFELGFLAIIVPEGYLSAREVMLLSGRYYFLQASTYINASFCALVLGHGLFSRRLGVLVAVKSKRRLSERPQREQRRILMGYIVLLLLIYMYVWVGPALVAFRGGRVAVTGGGGLAFLMPFFSATGLILPGLIALYCFRFRGWGAGRALALSSPVILIQFIIGTRFPLLFSIVGWLVVYLVYFRVSAKGIFLTVVLALTLLSASTLMRSFRTHGLANFDVGQFVDEEISAKPKAPFERADGPMGEGVVYVMAEIMRYFRSHEPLRGRSSAMITVFWVPRVLWPSKPTLMGYWFPRVRGEGGFSKGHSVSYTFAGDAYADFGFNWGVAFCFFLGILFGRVDRWSQRQVQRSDKPWIIIASALYPATFFAVRSLQTATITMFGIGFWVVLLRVLWLSPKRRGRRRPAPGEPSPLRGSHLISRGR